MFKKSFFKKVKINAAKSVDNKAVKNAGFTLLEMMLVLGIFGIITSMVMWNYGAFNNNIVLGNLAYEVALQIRQSQVFSLGVRGAGGTFDNRYGTFFTTTTGSSGNFVNFIDKEGVGDEGICDDGSPPNSCLGCTNGSECQSLTTLPRNMVVSKICVSSDSNPFGTNNTGCSSGSSDSGIVYITFHRPDPTAIIKKDNTATEYGSVGIVLKSPDNQYKAVIIRKTGQISVVNYKPS